MHIYLITNLINNKQYIGAEKGNNQNYFGSGRLIIEAIEEFGKENFKKEILIDSEYIDSWEECLELESGCILSLNTLCPNGYNKTFWSYPFPIETLRKGGKIVGKQNKELKRGFFVPGVRNKGGKRIKELGVGIFAPGMHKKAGKIGGERNKELGTGIFAPENIGKGGKRSYELGVGVHVPGVASGAGKIGGKIGGKISGKRHKELGTAIFALGMQSKGGKMKAHMLFEIDEIFQRMTLGTLLKT